MPATLTENSKGLPRLLQGPPARAGRWVRHPRRQSNQVDKRAPLEWKVDDLLLLDGVFNGRRFHL